MNQQTFEEQSRERWREIDVIISELERKPAAKKAERLPPLYRQLCADVALAQHRMYGARLCTELNERLIRCRNVLGRTEGGAGAGFARFLMHDFPRAVRREWRLFWLAFLLFAGPVAAFVAAAHWEPRWIFAVLGPDEIRQMDGMYGEDDPTEFLRGQFGSDFAMFGFYVFNNISIGLRMAGMGLLAVVGSVFALAYQGIMIGAMEGYVHYSGNVERFYTFVAGHSAFELGGIIICGAAGMRLGMGVLKPGRLSRGAALARAGRQALPLICGGVFLIFLAAFIEAFWSASAAAKEVKWAAGVFNVVLLTAYLLFVGRKGGPDET